MKGINNIEDWYRDELSNYDVEPSKNGWNALSNELDISTPLTEDNISDWYKKEVNKLEERPDYTVWEKLSTKLDTSSVWEKLSASLTRYEQYIWWRNTIIKSSAILLLIGGSYTAYQQFKTSELTSKKNNSYSVSIPSINANEKIQKEINNTDNEKKSQTSATQNTLSKSKSKLIVALNSEKATISSSSTSNKTLITETVFKKIKPKPIEPIKENKQKKSITNNNRSGISESDISAGFEKKDFLVKKKKNKIVFNNKRFSAHFVYGLYARRFYLGVNFGVKKQGMLTSLKNNLALGEFKQQNFLNFGNTFGSTFGWIVSDKLNIETNLNFISTAGYNTSFSNEANTFEEELKLNYTTLSILVKRMSNKSTFDNKKYSTNLIAGLYGGYLVNSSSIINGKTYKNNSFNNMDFGIVLGIEQDRYITKSLVITPGIRFQQGLINIANSTSSFQSARNSSLEFNLGIKYIFLKKR